MVIILLILLISPVYFQFAAGLEECLPTRCSPSGPTIRFPFRLKAQQPVQCGYPGFDLSCNPNNNHTEFEFQFPVRASARNVVLPVSAKGSIKEIDYARQVIRISVGNASCLPARVPEAGSTPSPFELYIKTMYYGAGSGYTLFNCSGEIEGGMQPLGPMGCLRRGNYRVYAYPSYYSVTDLSVSRCVKMYNVSDVSEALLGKVRDYAFDDTYLHWPRPGCGEDCEARGNYCGSNANNQTGCFDIPNQPQRNTNAGVVIAVVVVGVFVMAVALGVVIYICSVNTSRKDSNRSPQKQTS